MLDSLFPLALFSVVTLMICYVVYVVLYGKHDSNDETDKDKSKSNTAEIKNGVSQKSKKKTVIIDKKPAKIKRRGSKDDEKFTHPWLLTTLKAHLCNVVNLNLSPNEKFLLSSGQDDRSCFIWMTKDFLGDHKQIKVNVGFENATIGRWSPDNKAFILSKDSDKSLEVFKLGKKPDGSVGNIQSATKFKQIHKGNIIGLDIACNGKFIMSCSDEDNLLVIWDLKGGVLEELTMPYRKTNFAKVSYCGRYVATGGIGPDVNVYKVNFSPTGEFKDVEKSYQLKGHEGDIFNFDFNVDSSKIVTISSDAKWRLFDTTGSRVSVEKSAQIDENIDEENPPKIILSKKALIIAVGIGRDIKIYSGNTSNLLISINSAHSSPIKDLIFSECEKYFITCGDKSIQVFHNICGYEETIQDYKLQIKDSSLSSALKNRLTSELKQHETYMNEIKKDINI